MNDRRIKWALVVVLVLASAWASYSIGSGHSVSYEPLLEKIKPWAEVAYFLHGPILVFITLFGLQQLKLTKEDISIRNERAAKEKAIEYASHYASKVIPLNIKALTAISNKNLVWPKWDVTDFTPGSVPRESLAYASTILGDLDIGNCVYDALNELQALSAAFYTGVADEQIGFEIMGLTFCDTVNKFYPYICATRIDKANPLWKFIVELDGIWRSRMIKNALELNRQNIDNQITSVPTKQGATIGYNRH